MINQFSVKNLGQICTYFQSQNDEPIFCQKSLSQMNQFSVAKQPIFSLKYVSISQFSVTPNFSRKKTSFESQEANFQSKMKPFSSHVDSSRRLINFSVPVFLFQSKKLK